MSSDSLYIKRNRPVTKVVTAGYTRPADTTTYAVGDVVADSTSAATILTFSSMARSPGGGGIIQSAVLIDSAAQTLKGDLELYLFDTTISMQNDNVAWAPSDSDMLKCLGRIRFSPGMFNVAGANGVVDTDSIGKPFACVSGSRDLYGILVVRNAYVPISGEVFTIRLIILQD